MATPVVTDPTTQFVWNDKVYTWDPNDPEVVAAWGNYQEAEAQKYYAQQYGADAAPTYVKNYMQNLEATTPADGLDKWAKPVPISTKTTKDAAKALTSSIPRGDDAKAIKRFVDQATSNKKWEWSSK